MSTLKPYLKINCLHINECHSDQLFMELVFIKSIGTFALVLLVTSEKNCSKCKSEIILLGFSFKKSITTIFIRY